MIIPAPLHKGATIGIVAPARKISKKELNAAINIIQDLGYKIKYAEHLFGENNQFSGTDQKRASDLMAFFTNPEVSAILCARGGYGTVRLLPYLNTKIIKQNPKWIIGYSDITVLHSLLHNEKIASIHASMPINFKNYTTKDQSIQSLFSILRGQGIHYKIKSNTNNRIGKAEGILIGGNLSILYSLRGTPIDLNTKDKILFIEDLEEYLYHIDRIMMNLKIGGFLDNLKGLIVGGINDMNDNTIPFGKTAKEIIFEAIQEYNFPVIFDFPAGHIHNNYALPFGQNIAINVTKESAVLNTVKI